jgi:hypothetical protein
MRTLKTRTIQRAIYGRTEEERKHIMKYPPFLVDFFLCVYFMSYTSNLHLLTPWIMDDLETDVQIDAINHEPIENDEVTGDTPSDTGEDAEQVDEDLTVEDPKEKRHLQQQAGRLQQIEKAREKARELEEKNRSYEELLQKNTVEEVFTKATSTEHWLEYFKWIYKTDPQLANKVAREKWNMSAKDAILASSKNNADSWDDDDKKSYTREQVRAEVEHELSVELAKDIFKDLSEDERKVANTYFDKFSWSKMMDRDEARELADMAKHYAVKDREVNPVQKEKILSLKASTIVKSTKPDTQSDKINWTKEQVESLWLHDWQLRQMFPEFYK